MRTHDFARAIAQEINQASADHVTTVEPTVEPGYATADAPNSARWSCSCGAGSDYDYLSPPTAEKQAAEHLARATRPKPSEVDGA